MTIKLALGGMVALNQFFLWRLTWDAEKNKYQKRPVRPDSPTLTVSAQDPANWMPFDMCEQWANYLNTQLGTDTTTRYAMGFYFTRNCGYWFLDVDKAINNGQISDVGNYLITALQGAAFEYSSSGTGFHMFGRGQLPEDWQQKPTGTGLELYNDGRGVAFGLSGQMWGNADLDFSAVMLQTICPAYFPPHANGQYLGNDFEQPRPDYYSTETDEELIIRACRTVPKGALLDTTHCTFDELWNADPIVKTIYEDDSAIDFSIAVRLAFWTGCDAPRIERLMRSNPRIYREKWDSHKTYLRELTIHRACAATDSVWQEKKLEVETVEYTDTPLELDTEHEDFSGVAFLEAKHQKILFEGCAYVMGEHKIFQPRANGSYMLLSSEQFNALYGAYSFKLNDTNADGSITKKAFDCFIGSKLVKFNKVDALKFNPLGTPRSIFIEHGVSYINSYAPKPIKRMAGDASPFVNLIKCLYPNGNDTEILLCWMAAQVQNVGCKFTWSCVLQGVEGSGKTTITECLSYAVGADFVISPDARTLTEKFNGWQDGKLLVIVNEMAQGKNYSETEGILKRMITDRTLLIEKKGRDQYTATNYANYIFTLNNKQDFKKVRGNRRFCVMYSALQTPEELSAAGLTETYFTELFNWLNTGGYAVVAEFLHTYSINPTFNPAGECVRAPESSSELEVYENGRTNAENILREHVEEQSRGFRGGWLCWQRAVDALDGKISRPMLEKFLNNMGYYAHSGLLPHGWTDNPLADEGGKRARLYCTAEIEAETRNFKRSQIVLNYQQKQA